MKISFLKNSMPVKYIKAVYYASKPLPTYKAQPQRPDFLKKENKIIKFLKKIF